MLTVSESIRQEILAQYGVQSDRVVVAYNGVDDCFEARAEASDPRRRATGRRVESPFILAVNLTNPRKNAGRLFCAFAEVLRRREKPLALVAVGGWDLRDANLWRLAYDAGVSDRVVITGYIPRPELLGWDGAWPLAGMPGPLQGCKPHEVRALWLMLSFRSLRRHPDFQS